MPDFKRNETVIKNPTNTETQNPNLMSFQSQINSIEYQRLCMMSQYSQFNQFKIIQYNQLHRNSSINMINPNQEEYLYQIYKCQQALLDTKYKTELCKSFISEGFCRYQLKCRFAHGIHDLINKSRESSKKVSTEKEKNDQESIFENEKDETCCSTSVSNSVDIELNKSLNDEGRNTNDLSKSTLNASMTALGTEDLVEKEDDVNFSNSENRGKNLEINFTGKRTLFDEFNKLDTSNSNGLYFMKLKKRLPVFKKYTENSIHSGKSS